MASRLEVIRAERIKKLEELKRLNINPYPSKINLDGKLIKISEARESDGKKVLVAGRVMGTRGHGAILFGDLRDESGQIQLPFSEEKLKEKYSILKLIDTGDFLAIAGKIVKTKAGEITVEVSDFQLLSKSINPLPSVWHGLKDVEERYRKRYLDAILNPEVAERLHKRSLIVSAIRELLNSKGFLEVETPTLQPLYGGGFARPFTTHHNTLDSDFYLRISDEMYLKRLIVGGCEKVYEITKVFRNEGMDQDHNPEFTMFEAQIAYEDYTYGMDIIEDIFEYSAKKVFGKTQFEYQGNMLDFKKPWNKMKLVDEIKKIGGVDALEWKTLDEAKKAMQGFSIDKKKIKELQKMNTIGEVIAFAFEELVEEKLIQPTIIYDYPIEVSPLAKKCDDERFTQRFEMFAAGSELGNNYSELNDPLDLRKRFVDEKKKEAAGNDEAHQTDEDYLTAIEHGFPPTCGLGIGVDRMAMIMTNAKTIKEIIAFPTLKPEFPLNSKKKSV